MATPFITAVPSKPPNSLFNVVSRLIAAYQLDTRPALSVGKAALVILDNGRGATFILATCDTAIEAEAMAKRFRAEMARTDFDEWSRHHDVPNGFLARPRDRGPIQKLIAGLRPLR